MADAIIQRTRLACLVLWILFLPVAIESVRCQEPKTTPNISPDRKVQAAIARLIYANDEDDIVYRTAFKQLRELAGMTPEVLMPQLVHYSLHAKNEKEGVGMIGLMGYFTGHWGSNVRRALTPYLESKDERIRREVAIWLANADERLARKAEFNLVHYRDTLLASKKSPPAGLVSYLYGRSASQSLLLFGEIYSEQPKFGAWPRPLMWSDHIVTTIKWRLRNHFLEEGDIEKAQKELDTLSKHDGWFARRYVVEIILADPRLGTAEILTRLKKDPHPLVREAAKFIK